MLIEHLGHLRWRLTFQSGARLFPRTLGSRWQSTATQPHDGPPVTDTNRICHFP